MTPSTTAPPTTAVPAKAHPPGIALSALVLAGTDRGAHTIGAVVRESYPGSVITEAASPEEAGAALASTIFDLVVLEVDPQDGACIEVIEALHRMQPNMPAVIVVGCEAEEGLYTSGAPICSTWEIVPREVLSPLTLDRRIRKAIENHQRRWELSHLQNAFQSSLVQYRNLFDEVPDLIFLCDRSGCLLDVNSSATRLFGAPKEALLMQPIFDKFGMSHDDFDRLVGAAMEEHGRIEDQEICLQHEGREPVFGLVHLIRWQQAPGRPVQFQGVVKDISPHKRLEQKLRRSEDRYKTLYDMARISSSSLRLDEVVSRSLILIHECCQSRGTALLINDTFEELNLLEAIEVPEGVRQRLKAEPPMRIAGDALGRICVRGGVLRIENPAVELDHAGLRAWCHGRPECQLIIAAMGRGNPTLPTSLLLTLAPAATAEHLDDELLGGLARTLEMGMTNCFHYANSQEAESRYRQLWDNAPAFFISMLKGGAIIEINQTAMEALGYSSHELIGKPFASLVLDGEHKVFEDHHSTLMAAGLAQDYELRLQRSNGETMIVSIKSEPLVDRNGMRIGEKAVLYDITRDKMLEARLRDYAENLERMVENRTTELTETMNFLHGILEGSTEYAIVGLDAKGTFLHFNRGAQLLFEYSVRQMVGERGIDSLIEFEQSPWRSLADLLAVLDERGVIVAEAPMFSSDGRQMTALLTMNRLKNPTSNNLTYVAIIRDITEQKEMEDLLKLYTENLQQVIEEKSRELDRQHIQIIQSSKLATLGEMATGIAHELNQPLSGIGTRAQLVLKALQKGMVNKDRIEQNQHEILQLIDRISNIINHMRTFARQDKQKFAPFQLMLSVQGAVSLIGEQLRMHAIELSQSIPSDLPLVFGEPLHIEQVIINLISNARDAVDGRAESERLHQRPYQKKLTIRASHPIPGEICLEVEDNGTGMSEETRAKVFEPFFTTKPVGRGTGLGLSISYGILTNHQGRLEVESVEGEGTRFRVWLPVWDASRETAVKPAAEDLPL